MLDIGLGKRVLRAARLSGVAALALGLASVIYAGRGIC